MDEDEINNLVQACKLLKNKFRGVFAADNFPVNLSHNSFIIVNVSTSQSIGTHWTFFCRRKEKYIFADPLGQNLASYKHLHNRPASSADKIQTVYESLRYQPIQKPNSYIIRYQPIQKPNSLLCGLFCIYIAHYLFGETEILKMSDVDSIRFALRMML